MLYDWAAYPSIFHHLEAIANRMWEGVRDKLDCVFIEINNNHSAYLGMPIEALKERSLALQDCQTSIANELGFGNWEEVKLLKNEVYSVDFEKAVNYVIQGDTEALEKALEKQPNLVIEQSKYAHQATLLHYTASNGVEMWRQQVPANLPEVGQLLIDRGAKRAAVMNVYGGHYNTLALLKTSEHPKKAGVLKEMMQVLSTL